MSRSVKNRRFKHGGYFHWVTFKSNKIDKQFANRSMRRTSKRLIKLGKDPIYHIREICDNWNFDSDGECYYRSFNQPRMFTGGVWTEEEINYMNRK